MKGARLVPAFVAMIASPCCLAVSEDIDPAQGCAQNPQRVAACFAVHGRLSTYNGNPTWRLWPVGTRRLLGVVAQRELLPASVRELVGFERDVYGDFVVCPFTPAQQGRMQFVCIEAADAVRVRQR
jgi:hypothetical protein